MIKSVETLIPPYFKGFLIQKYINDIIFYISALISLFILINGINLVENKIGEENNDNSPFLEDEEEKNYSRKIINLIKNKNIILLLSLIFILESSSFCVSPLFYYKANILGLNPQDLGNIDFLSHISII